MVKYTAVTGEICVDVYPVYLDGESSYSMNRFIFAYFVIITNNGQNPVRLCRRYWNIREKNRRSKEVEGEGVVGKQPLIEAGESYYYDSFCILKSFEGSMEGTYTMEDEDGRQFRVTIPRFDLKAMAN